MSTRRDEARARLAVTAEALGVLEQALRTEVGLAPETARSLLAGARALCPVAASTGTELAVSAGPDHRWTVFVASDAGVPLLRLRRLSIDPVPSTGADPATDVAGQLADLLRGDRTRW